jgi:hypothetical protein
MSGSLASLNGPLREVATVRKYECFAGRVPNARLGASRRWGADATPCCAGFAAVLALGSRRKTRFTRCARCTRTDAASQLTKRASTRADPRAAFLAVAYAPQRRPAPCLARNDRSLERVLASHGHRARGLPRAAGAPQGESRARCPAFGLLPQRTGAASPSRGRVCAGAPVRRRGAQGFGRRAYPRASSTDSPHLFERNERSE